jgi:hypothetical protein
MANDIFSFKSPEEKKRQQKWLLTWAGIGAIAVALVVTGILVWVNRPEAEMGEPPVIATERPIEEIIAELRLTTNREFTEDEATLLAGQISDEWAPRATEEEKVQLYLLQAQIYTNAELPSKAIDSLKTALMAAKGDDLLDVGQRLVAATREAGRLTEAKEYAMMVVGILDAEGDRRRMVTWERIVTELGLMID